MFLDLYFFFSNIRENISCSTNAQFSVFCFYSFFYIKNFSDSRFLTLPTWMHYFFFIMASLQLHIALCLSCSVFSPTIFDYPTLDGYVTNKVLRFTTHIGIHNGLIGMCLPPQRNTLILTNMHFIT